MLTTGEVLVSESDESDSDEEGDGLENSSNIQDLGEAYQYLPPLQCSILKHVPVDSISSEEATSRDVQESSVSVILPVSVSDSGSDPVSDPTSVVNGSQSHSDAESEKFKLSPNTPEFVPTGLSEEETTETCTDDQPGSVESSNEQHTSEQVAVQVQPVDVPFPTPSYADFLLTSVLNPQVLSYVAHLPPEQQQHIKEHIAGMWKALLPKSVADQSGHAQSGGQKLDQSKCPSTEYSNRALSLEATEQGQEGRQRALISDTQKVAPVSALPGHSVRLRETRHPVS